MGFCKKKKSLSDEDFEKEYGRHWIWASIDPESKLIVNFFVGQRTVEDCRIFIDDLISRIRTKPLFTSDELPHYQTVLLERFSHMEEQTKTGKRGRPKQPRIVVDPELKYATVHKTRQNGKVVKVERKVVFGNLTMIRRHDPNLSPSLICLLPLFLILAGTGALAARFPSQSKVAVLQGVKFL